MKWSTNYSWMHWSTVLTSPGSLHVHQSSVYIVLVSLFSCFLSMFCFNIRKRVYDSCFVLDNSLNHRKIPLGRDLRRSLTQPHSQRKVSSVTRLGCSQLYPNSSWKTSKEGNCTTSLDNLLGCSHGEKISPYLQSKTLLFQFMPDASYLLPHTVVWTACLHLLSHLPVGSEAVAGLPQSHVRSRLCKLCSSASSHRASASACPDHLGGPHWHHSSLPRTF